MSALAPRKRDWMLFRECYQDPSGEYNPSNYYKGEKVLVTPKRIPTPWTSVACPENYPITWVKLVVSVSGLERGAVLRVQSWSARITMGEHSLPVIAGKAQSLAEVYRIVDSLFFDYHVEQIMRRFYSKQSARCIYRLDEAGEWQPFSTGFYHMGASNWPDGKYLEVTRAGRMNPSRTLGWVFECRGSTTIGSCQWSSAGPGWLDEKEGR